MSFDLDRNHHQCLVRFCDACWLLLVGSKKFQITRYGSGDQKVSLSRIETNAEAVVAVLRNPERYKDRPVYIADHAISTNELIAMVESILPDQQWTIVNIADVEGIEREARRMWDEDTKVGVTDRLHSKAWVRLVLGSFFNEQNAYGAYFGEKLEPGWGREDSMLKQQMKILIDELRN